CLPYEVLGAFFDPGFAYFRMLVRNRHGFCAAVADADAAKIERFETLAAAFEDLVFRRTGNLRGDASPALLLAGPPGVPRARFAHADADAPLRLLPDPFPGALTKDAYVANGYLLAARAGTCDIALLHERAVESAEPRWHRLSTLDAV